MMGWQNEKKVNNRSVCRREEMGFQFWLKRRYWRRMPHREWKRVPDHRSCVLKGSLPQGSSAHPRNMEYPRLSEKSEKVSRDEATRRGMGELYQRQCGSRWELICIESGCCIIIIKPRENKRGNESFGGFIRKILSDWTNPPDLQVSKLTEFLLSYSNGKGSLGHYHCHWHWHVCYSPAVLLRLFYINGYKFPAVHPLRQNRPIVLHFHSGSRFS